MPRPTLRPAVVPFPPDDVVAARTVKALKSGAGLASLPPIDVVVTIRYLNKVRAEQAIAIRGLKNVLLAYQKERRWTGAGF